MSQSIWRAASGFSDVALLPPAEASSSLLSDFGLARAEKAWVSGEGVRQADPLESVSGFTFPFVSPAQGSPRLSRDGWPAELGRELEGEVGFEDPLELPGDVQGVIYEAMAAAP